MPQLQIPNKGPRKRRSTTAMREDDGVQKQVAHASEEGEIDMSDMMAKIKKIV